MKDQTTYYATPEMVKNFLQTLPRDRKELPQFPEALKMMMERGLLSRDPISKPRINGQMTRSAFMTAYDRIPFEANRVINVLRKEREENRQIALPDTIDIACAQHIHTYGYTRQTLKNVFSFTYIFQGICTVSLGEDKISLKPGDIFIACPGLEHAIHTTPETFAIIIVARAEAFETGFQDFLASDLVLSEFFRKYILDKAIGNYCVIHGAPEDEELRFYIQSLASEYMDQKAYYSNTCSVSFLKLFLARAFRKYHSQMDFYQQHFSVLHPDADRLYQYMQAHYQDITLSQMAQAFHFNPSYLSRYISLHLHRSFSEIVTDLRITHAKEYLRKTNKCISEIASLTGYESLNHFTKTFRKMTGQTPSEYRKS